MNLSESSPRRSSSSPTANNNGPIANGRRLKITYAEWITKAILSASTKCLALAEINEWMASNVPGLKEQKFLHSSQGWKNAVRHTLSVNRGRFEKVPREGRPSLWTLTEKFVSGTDNAAVVDSARRASSKSASSPDEPPSKLFKQDNGIRSSFCKQQDLALSSCKTQHQQQHRDSTVSSVYNKLPETPPAKQSVGASIDTSSLSANTQTIQVVFNDGVTAVIVLPRPLPVCGYGGGSPEAATPLLNTLGSFPPIWDDSHAAFLTQALIRHRASAPTAQNSFPVAGCFG